VDWIKKNDYYDQAEKYGSSEKDYIDGKNQCLDDDDAKFENVIGRNVDFKYGLEEVAPTGSCYGLVCLIYQVLRIEYVFEHSS
jgi:hypothetical protein